IFLEITDALNEVQTISLPESELRASYGTAAIDNLKTTLVPLWGQRVSSSQKASIITQISSFTQFNLPTDFTWDFADDGIPSAPQFQVKVNGILIPSDVQQVGFKRRPLLAPREQGDLRIENALYLKLSQPIPDDALVEVTNPDWPAKPRFIAVNKALRYSPVIHVNQEGYLPSTPQTVIL